MSLESMLLQNARPRDAEGVAIAVITNITLEPYFYPALTRELLQSGLYPEIVRVPYDECEKHTDALREACCVFVWPCLRELAPEWEKASEERAGILSDRLLRLYECVRAATGAPLFWMGLEDYDRKSDAFTGFVSRGFSVADECNRALSDKGLVLLDLKRMIAEVGTAAAYDAKSLYRWNAPYGRALLEEAARQLAKRIFVDRGLSPKCLVLDCDNVLWGGILSEDGMEGVALGENGQGRAYRDFQRHILSLAKRGILLALCSKNDEDELLAMLRTHSGMMIKEEHISHIEAGWGDKPAALRRIAAALHIGLESIVFVDDSAFETEAVRAMLPQVKTVRFDRLDIYRGLNCFHLSPDMTEDKTAGLRLKTLRDDKQRQRIREESAGYRDFIESLGQKIDIRPAEPHEYARISELSQRTNRCTNGKRYTLHEVGRLAEREDYRLHVVYVADRLGDLGLVGAMGCRGSVLDLFCLSCRALGRGIEEEMLKHVSFESFEKKDTGKNGDLLHALSQCVG